ncbi:MAG: DegT/DnrJ/EryC1/StrS family aminotransferase [Deltaproteobacteria bacterium]|nr:DegT/DnrJ/EryC1/StrS family aminotransferase [Deltaproteobacteria bacterium]
MIPMLDIKALHAPLSPELENAMLKVLRSGQYINGPAVAGFEAAFANWIGACNVVGVSSGSDALLVSLMALRVRPGDKIITTPYSFFATTGAIVRLGAIPVFVDIEPETFALDHTQIEQKIDADTVGILPVHLFGAPANMEHICKIAKRHHLWVVEDAAQALGAQFNDQHVGVLGDAGVFSFFPAKNLGAAGDAGAVVTQDDQIAHRIRQLRGHGASRRYHHQLIGGNFRMDTLQAAFLEVKLPFLNGWNTYRRNVAVRYTQSLAMLSHVTCPTDLPGHVYNQYVIQVPAHQRKMAIQALSEKSISSAVYYPTPLHLQPALSYLRYRPGAFPVAEQLSQCALALPINPTITPDEQQRVIQTLTICVGER